MASNDHMVKCRLSDHYFHELFYPFLRVRCLIAAKKKNVLNKFEMNERTVFNCISYVIRGNKNAPFIYFTTSNYPFGLILL